MLEKFFSLNNTEIKLIAIATALIIYLAPKGIKSCKRFISWLKWKKENHFVRKTNKRRRHQKIIYINTAKKKQ